MAPPEIAPQKFASFWAAQERRHHPAPDPENVWYRLHRLRTRRLMAEHEAEAVWLTFADGRSTEAALGELVAALVDAEMLPEGTVVRWPA